LKLSPEQKLTVTLPCKTRRIYRWVEHLPYTDSQKRSWTLGALLCEETSPTGEKTTFAWLTSLAVNRDSLIAIADQVGRLRTKIENEGFNVEKNSGLNLEHVFSQKWDHAKAYSQVQAAGRPARSSQDRACARTAPVSRPRLLTLTLVPLEASVASYHGAGGVRSFLTVRGGVETVLHP
jgi:hypothetical protein